MAPVASRCRDPSFRPKCGSKYEQFAFHDAALGLLRLLFPDYP